MQTSLTPVFCYGSNNPDQLSERIGRRPKMEGAYLEGYHRIFVGFSRKWNGGVGSLEKAPGETVYGLVAYLSQADIKKLDSFEGWYPDNSGSTIKKNLKITTQEGNPLTAIVYLGTATNRNPPSKAYREAVAKTISAFWSNSDGSGVTYKDITVRRNPEACGSNPFYSRKNPSYWGKAAAGILFFCEDQILLTYRSIKVDKPNVWGIPGGSVSGEGFYDSQQPIRIHATNRLRIKVKPKEELTIDAFWKGAIKEVKEELGSVPESINYFDHVIFKDGDFKYITFFVRITPEARAAWRFRLNWENTAANWFKIELFGKTSVGMPLHDGVRYVIQQRKELFFPKSTSELEPMRFYHMSEVPLEIGTILMPKVLRGQLSKLSKNELFLEQNRPPGKLARYLSVFLVDDPNEYLVRGRYVYEVIPLGRVERSSWASSIVIDGYSEITDRDIKCALSYWNGESIGVWEYRTPKAQVLKLVSQPPKQGINPFYSRKNPWTKRDVIHKNKRAASNPKTRELWVRVANATLARTGDDRMAIIAANMAVKNYFSHQKKT